MRNYLMSLFLLSALHVSAETPAAWRYGVPKDLLTAIEYHESRGGAGNLYIADYLSETQLTYLYKIARHTGRPAHLFRGNSYGAMGVMQIIPSTFWTYAQDGDGDGIKDPMNAHDSRATAAYYLAVMIAKHGEATALRRYTGGARYAQILCK